MSVSLACTMHSYSLVNRRFRESQANERSTPPARLGAESACHRFAFDDFELPFVALLLVPLRQVFGAVGSICPDVLVARKKAGEAT
jgi:hypothetical protein